LYSSLEISPENHRIQLDKSHRRPLFHLVISPAAAGSSSHSLVHFISYKLINISLVLSMAGKESCSASTLDIDEIASSMALKLQNQWSMRESYRRETKQFRISKVSEKIRKFDRKSYDPIIVSIGPYHYGNPALLAMQKEKWDCLNYILKVNRNKKLQDYLEAIGKLQDQAMYYYSDEIKMNYDEFLQMLVLDGCFIFMVTHGPDINFTPAQIERSENHEIIGSVETTEGEVRIDSINGNRKLLPSPNNTKHEVELSDTINTSAIPLRGHTNNEKDAVPHKIGPWYANFTAHDILLLDNQVPFFVVEGVFELVTNGESAEVLYDKVAEYMEDYLQYYPLAIQHSSKPDKFHHLLHFCHMYFRPSQKLQVYNQYKKLGRLFHFFVPKGSKYLVHGDLINQNLQQVESQRRKFLGRWHQARQYHEAGIQFKKREFNKDKPHSLLDIKFTNGVVEIPCLVVDENTEALFRNLIALEQTCPTIGKDFTAYISFICQLTTTPSDVTLLGRRGVVLHHLRSDEELCKRFATLGKNVDFDLDSEHYLLNVFWAMEEYYQNRLNRWMAWLRQNHFNNPWLSLAVLAAALVLLCTLLQTLFAFLVYFKPIKGGDDK